MSNSNYISRTGWLFLGLIKNCMYDRAASGWGCDLRKVGRGQWVNKYVETDPPLSRVITGDKNRGMKTERGKQTKSCLKGWTEERGVKAWAVFFCQGWSVIYSSWETGCLLRAPTALTLPLTHTKISKELGDILPPCIALQSEGPTT